MYEIYEITVETDNGKKIYRCNARNENHAFDLISEFKTASEERKEEMRNGFLCDVVYERLTVHRPCSDGYCECGKEWNETHITDLKGEK